MHGPWHSYDSDIQQLAPCTEQPAMIPTAWSTAVSETAHKDVPAPVDNPMSNMVPPRTRCHVFSIYRTILDLDDESTEDTW